MPPPEICCAAIQRRQHGPAAAFDRAAPRAWPAFARDESRPDAAAAVVPMQKRMARRRTSSTLCPKTGPAAAIRCRRSAHAEIEEK